MRPTSGLTFGGRYQLSSRIAIGGMGEVWQATDLVIGRTVAIKILKDEYMGDPGFLERFRAEARHAALVSHEGIANVFDYGEEEGSAYLVMELVPGEALSAILERERVLSTDRVLDFVAQTANALQAAHAVGLVHRDIKPGNLLITPDGRVKITDFGIARIADQVPLTATGQVMGTVQYLSPEQASGHPASPSTDIYSLGIVAYEALAGRRPFTGESQVAIAMAQINEAPPELPVAVSEPVKNLVYSSIAKRPDERPSTAAHLARAAQALRRGDVAGAAVAVPAIAGAASLATLTGGGADATTRLLQTQDEAVGTGTAETPVEEERKRNPWTWPLIALVTLLGIVLIGVLIALLANPEQTPEAETTRTTTSAPPTQTSAPPTSSAPTTVALSRDEIRGKTRDEVEGLLTDRGLALDPVNGSTAPSVDQQGRAYDASPVGNLQPGTTVRVSFYSEIPSPPAPAAPTLQQGGPVGPDDDVDIRWDTYNQCPSGTSLTGYTFTISSNGRLPELSNNVAQSNVRDTPVQIQGGTEDVTISYVANCGEFISEPSGTLTIDVTEPIIPTPSAPPGT
ncbi:protein kinase [Diaminobutyricimonas sp. TR449]|uniref:protein kinase domain-containing protein n=1 Tax=Diaminobutyricimonas sp. TR449 TaxID=2708076 RepID=UPI00142280B2|nr:protein kinase [Diaminobutyricimonas sp. TR449]